MLNMSRPPGVVTSSTDIALAPEIVTNCRMLSQTTLASSHSRESDEESDCSAIEGWGVSKQRRDGGGEGATAVRNEERTQEATDRYSKRGHSATSVSVCESTLTTTKLVSVASNESPSPSASLEDGKQHWTPSGVLIHNSRSPGACAAPRFRSSFSPWQPPPPANANSTSVSNYPAPPPPAANCKPRNTAFLQCLAFNTVFVCFWR